MGVGVNPQKNRSARGSAHRIAHSHRIEPAIGRLNIRNDQIRIGRAREIGPVELPAVAQCRRTHRQHTESDAFAWQHRLASGLQNDRRGKRKNLVTRNCDHTGAGSFIGPFITEQSREIWIRQNIGNCIRSAIIRDRSLHQAYTMAVIGISLLVTIVKRLDRRSAGIMPAVNDHWVGNARIGEIGVDLCRNNHILLIAAHQGAQGKGIRESIALSTNHSIVVRKNRHGGHFRAGSNRLRSHFHGRIGPDLVYHLARRQRASQRVA